MGSSFVSTLRYQSVWVLVDRNVSKCRLLWYMHVHYITKAVYNCTTKARLEQFVATVHTQFARSLGNTFISLSQVALGTNLKQNGIISWFQMIFDIGQEQPFWDWTQVQTACRHPACHSHHGMHQKYIMYFCIPIYGSDMSNSQDLASSACLVNACSHHGMHQKYIMYFCMHIYGSDMSNSQDLASSACLVNACSQT